MTAELEPPAVADEVNDWLFLRHLRASKLLPVADMDAVERLASAESLPVVLDRLIADGTLSEYQRRRVAAGEPEGLVFGQYRVLDELGAGGCGRVYKARHALTDRVVALKVINPELNRDVTIREMFVREAVATTRLSHPNIAAAYHADEHAGQVFLAMEYVQGRTLQQVVDEDGPLDPDTACEVMVQVAAALQHAHEQGLVHRDIKPANIILASEPFTGRKPLAVKVIDFGLARHRTVARGILQTIPCAEGAVIGTPAYMAPEQITDVHSADVRADLYSLGCTIYYALSGKLPFAGATHELVLFQHLSADAPRLAGVSPGVARIVERLMAKDPAKRFQTPVELVEAATAGMLQCLVDTAGEAALKTIVKAVTRAVPPRAELPDTSVTLVPAPAPAPVATAVSAESAPEYDLRGLWEEWGGELEAAARGAASPRGNAEYRALYRHLLAAARTAAVQPPLAAGLRDELRTLVEPWVSRASLTDLDRRAMQQLRENCRALDERLWPVEPEPVRGGRAGVVLFAVVAFAAAAAAVLLR